MKAILIIDMPKDCLYCPCYDQDTEFGFEQCKVLLRSFESADERDNKPDWCPLKPMPQKKYPSFNELHFEEGYIEEGRTHGWKNFVKEKLTEYDMGYNNCIDEILGEEK